MEPILERIKKLLRLAGNNTNENEAALAMAKAQEMMLAHNIEHIDDTSEHVDMKPIRGQAHDEYDKQWHNFLAGAISILFNCRHTTSRGTGSITFWGRKANIEAAEATMTFVALQIEKFYKITLREFGGELGKRGRAELRATFKEAAALRIRQRCQDIVAAMNNRIPDYKALTVINTTKEEIDALFSLHGVRRSRKASKLRLGLGTGAGTAAGDAVQIQNSPPRPHIMIGDK